MTSARGTDHRPAHAILKASLRALVIRTAALYLRRAHVNRERGRIPSAVLPMLCAEDKTMGRRVVHCHHGFKMLADLEDWLGQYVYLTGVCEPTGDVVQMLIGPGDTVLDIGANPGFFSLLAAARVSSSGRVIAFEPIASVRALEANVARNGFADVRIRDEAASKRRATLRIIEGPAAHQGLSSRRQLDEVAGFFEVTAITLDDLQEEKCPLRLDKIDVEGADLLVLEGAAGVIARDRPHLIIESTDEYLRAFERSAEALSNWPFDRKYALYHREDRAVPPRQGACGVRYPVQRTMRIPRPAPRAGRSEGSRLTQRC